MLSTAEAAARLGIAAANVRQAALRGSLAIARRDGIGHRSNLFFDEIEVERYAREHSRRPGRKKSPTAESPTPG